MFGHKKDSGNDIYTKLEKWTKAHGDKIGTLSSEDMVKCIYSGYALDAVDFVRDNYGQKLDFSDESVKIVEAALTDLYDDMATAKPSEEQIETMAKMFGGYIGAVMVEGHGWHWKSTGQNELDYPMITVVDGDYHYLVVAKAYKRLINGPEDNVWDAFYIILNKLSKITD